MPAQSHATVWTAFMSPVEDEVNIGDVLIPNAAGDGYVVATIAARTAAGRTTTGAGVALTSWDSTNPNRAVEIQTVGPYPRGITELGAGAATTIRISDTGRLERGASSPLAGNCDADGFAYLNFTGTGGGGGGGGAPEDATYVTLSTNGTLTNERVLAAGTGVTVTDGGAGSTVTVAAPGLAAQLVTLATSGDLPNERVLTAGTGITVTDGGAGGPVTIASTITQGAPVGAQYLTLANDATLTAERRFVPGAGLSATDGGANGNYTLTSQGPTSIVPDSPSIASNRLDDYDASVGGVPSDLIHITYNISHGALTITSIANPTENRRITILNADDGTFGTSVIIDHAAATGTAANRILCPGGADITLSTRESALLQYDTTTDRWRVVSKSPASSFTAPTGTGFMTTTSGAMNAASTNPANVSTYRLTDTSAAQYDLLVANGSAEFRRFAKGSNSTVLNTSAAGVVNYGLVTLAMFTPGSNGQFLGTVSSLPAWTNNANFYAAFNSASGAGCFRGANANNAFTSRNAANSGDVYLCMLGTDDNLYLGSDQADANRTTGNRYNTASYHYFSVAGSFYLIMQSSAVQTRQSLEVGVNLAGCSALSTPLVLKKASIAMSGSTDATLTAAQYSCPFIYASGSVSSTPDIIAPATEGAIFVVSNDCNGDIRFGSSSGTGTTVTSEDTIWVIHTAAVSNYTTI